MLICDNDNVSPFGTNLGIMGKQRWMAPEIVMGKNDPDKNSDRFSLAVVLFRLLFINHPLEGRYSTPPCMTKEAEQNIMVVLRFLSMTHPHRKTVQFREPTII